MKLYGLFIVILLAAIAGCQAETPAPLEPVPEAEEGALFVDIREQAGITFSHYTGAYGKKYFPEMAGGGGGFLDYDGDGWEDILLVNGQDWPSNPGLSPPLELYRNEQDGTFRNTTSEAGLEISMYGMGMAAADYDNDGDLDLVVTAVGPNYFFRNEGGTFTDVTQEVGLTDESWSTSPMFFDYDNDGWLDLYVANYVKWSEETDLYCSLDGETKAYCTPEIYTGESSRLYRNRGNGTFEDVTRSAGVYNEKGKSLGVALLDANDDGWLDFAVANDTAPDFLFMNNGDGTFEEAGLVSGLALDEGGKARAGMGIDVGITDPTGEETIFIGNFSNETIGVYRDLGQGSYLDRAAVSRIGRSSMLFLTFGLFLFDYDLDFDLDVFAANGHVQPEVEDIQQAVTFRQRSLLYRNNNNGTFEEVAESTGSALQKPVVGRGAAYADIDRDGDQDILVITGGDVPLLLQNNAPDPSGNAVRVHLVGEESNKNGIGATVTAYVGGTSMVQRVKTGSSYLSQSELTLTFGTSGTGALDSLHVQWPSGHRDVVGAAEAGQLITLVEGSTRISTEQFSPGT